MEPTELLEQLVDLARDAGWVVRTEPAVFGLESGLCRVRGAVWLVLCRADPVEERIEICARALREHAAELLEERFLPPAVRARLGVG